VLIITNGDSAVASIGEAGIEAEVLPWRDVLHDGPVPADLSLAELAVVRARFLADEGWGAFEDLHSSFCRRDERLGRAVADGEVVLWFEHDLYDQLQLVQVMDWFAEPGRRSERLTLVCHDHFVSETSPDQLQLDFAERQPATEDQLALASATWAAIRSPTPEPWVDLLQEDHAAMPFVGAAMQRFIEELPGKDGLARSERQILRVVAEGSQEPPAAFPAVQRLEEAAYLGDASFFRYVVRLAGGPAPLLLREGDRLGLTDSGRAVLDGREDFVRIGGLQRWLGGVRLCRDNTWRWDAERRTLRHRKAE
jgi:hypothetical protein